GTPNGKNTLRTALGAGSSVLFMSSPWTQYERLTQKLMGQKADTVRNDMWIVSAPFTGWLRAKKLGRDSVRVENDHADVFHMRVDRSGRVLHARPVSGTGKFTVDRGTPDIAAVAAQWLAAEKAAGVMGALSVRDTVRAVVAGDSLWVDYGRPAKRGRNVFGEVVPFGEVWRTGANSATQLSTTRTLDFGGVLVPPGRYSIWTIPAAKGWTLILNSQSGQWGTEHDAGKDVCRIPLAVEALPDVVERFTINVVPRGAGGVLQLDRDTTRAWAEFGVK
ncbi:MAG: DUF2911 domain-containing protein, partial [Candidatus Eisenbacteria bacterium]|nr:DUF2911 domain-containing protein [Candidatus Eisenbacteria bacterium]